MKTSKMVEQLENLGYRVQIGEDSVWVFRDGETVVRGSKYNVGYIDTIWDRFTKLERYEKAELLKIMVEYSLTPLDEREGPKKYYWRLGGVGEYVLDNMYFARSPFNEEWHLTNKRDEATPYTEAEFKELYIRFNINLEFIEEEVE